ncbi:hypothetical protein K435DRAFT_816015 [Dendrothele bispora CBS 962.96]|uniref:CxC5 like cysteine cluster associated with KDZ domain-containing protein n=1 Tax=Dendrothele bispora (strain CBS 962.96) TaxID=1314807 RepID=A0A4S8MUQ7_DENBC|nr:hypothetical protein K435DRAFT_816015 [Dendrothele bispora CBS 962.96]
MELLKALRVLRRLCALKYLTLNQTSAFIRVSSCIKRDILQPQPIPQTTLEAPPDVLPPAVSSFLSKALNIPLEDIPMCWDLLKRDVWEATVPEETKHQDLELFKKYGWEHGITYLTIYPPSLYCVNHDHCNRTTPLKQEKMRQVVVFTLADGAQPAWAVNLVCPGCNTTYHNNFSVNDGTRTYYEHVPRYIQAGEHQFVEDKLVDSWITMMLLGWFSASNCAEHYNMSLSAQDWEDPTDWQFSLKVAMEHVWDAFIIKALLEDCEHHETLLTIPHTGNQDQRFTTAMQARNKVPHACDKCIRIVEDEDGTLKKAQILVCDGLSIGHTCCSVFRCTKPLATTKDRFCPEHANLVYVCSVNGCNKPSVSSRKTCDNPAHQAIEDKYTARGEAFFTLTERYRKTNQQSTEDDNMWFEVDNSGEVHVFSSPNPGSVGEVDDPNAVTYPLPCDKKSETGNRKMRAQFGRRRTHNEQLLVRPCGIIYARATFYGAEAVSNVILFVKAACSVPGAHKPELLVYDTACSLAKQLEATPDNWWEDIGLVVDVFHFLNKHKTTHEYCQKYCNPIRFPELVDEKTGKWWFNTSVAEQANVWMGKYGPILREMGVVKYNFFLDEMIMRRNANLVHRLASKGYNPRHMPPPSL